MDASVFAVVVFVPPGGIDVAGALAFTAGASTLGRHDAVSTWAPSCLHPDWYNAYKSSLVIQMLFIFLQTPIF